MNTTFGFVFVGSDWRKSVEDDWDIEPIDLNGNEKVLGHRQIDGSICKVLQASDGRVVAITKV